MYQLDKASAENGSGSASNFLEEGLHDVTIFQAYEIVASTGTKGVRIDFKSKQGANRQLTFYVQNAAGEKIFGMDQLHAIMAATKTKQLNAVQGVVTYYDFDTKKEQQKQVMILPELVNKPLSVILHKEANKNPNDGITRIQYSMTAPLVAGTLQTAFEVLNSKEAKQHTALIEAALKRSEKAVDEVARAQAGNPQPASPSAGSDYGKPADDLDQEIPF